MVLLFSSKPKQMLPFGECGARLSADWGRLPKGIFDYNSTFSVCVFSQRAFTFGNVYKLCCKLLGRGLCCFCRHHSIKLTSFMYQAKSTRGEGVKESLHFAYILCACSLFLTGGFVEPTTVVRINYCSH